MTEAESTQGRPLSVWRVTFHGEMLIAAEDEDEATELALDEAVWSIRDWTPSLTLVGEDDGGEDVLRRD